MCRRFALGDASGRARRTTRCPGDFEYCAVIEFDDVAGLRGYLAHPAHAELGRLFYATSREAFAADYDSVDASPASALQRWHAADR